MSSHVCHVDLPLVKQMWHHTVRMHCVLVPVNGVLLVTFRSISKCNWQNVQYGCGGWSSTIANHPVNVHCLAWTFRLVLRRCVLLTSLAEVKCSITCTNNAICEMCNAGDSTCSTWSRCVSIWKPRITRVTVYLTYCRSSCAPSYGFGCQPGVCGCLIYVAAKSAWPNYYTLCSSGGALRVSQKCGLGVVVVGQCLVALCSFTVTHPSHAKGCVGVWRLNGIAWDIPAAQMRE